jgi:hypothetical protein
MPGRGGRLRLSRETPSSAIVRLVLLVIYALAWLSSERLGDVGATDEA